MVKYIPERIKTRNKQYQEFCEKKKIKPGIYKRISWELMTRGIIPNNKFEPLDISKQTLERIFMDLDICSMQYTGVSPTELQTIDNIFHYTINHPRNRNKAQKIDPKEINRFLGNI